MLFKVLCEQEKIEEVENFRIISQDIFDIFVSGGNHIFSFSKKDLSSFTLVLEIRDTGRWYRLGNYSKPKYAAIALNELYEAIDGCREGVLSALTEKEIIDMEKLPADNVERKESTIQDDAYLFLSNDGEAKFEFPEKR